MLGHRSSLWHGDFVVAAAKLDFMGKSWDQALPNVKIWKECLRVLKPGSFAFVMCIPRSDLQSRIVADLEEAGFVTSFTPIYHAFANGFPKSTNISKMVDQRLGVEREVVGQKKSGLGSGKTYSFHQSELEEDYDKNVDITIPGSKEAKQLDGAYTFQPAPAVEVILVVMKPLSEQSYTDQALANKKGVAWLDDCRIPTNEKTKRLFIDDHLTNSGFPGDNDGEWEQSTKIRPNWETHKDGRFPSNVIVGDDALGDFSKYFDLDIWFQKKILDNVKKLPKEVQKTFPFLITPKPSKREKNAGLSGKPSKPPVFGFRPTAETNPENWNKTIDQFPHAGANRSGTQQNPHTTVKGIKLMSWLIMLGSRPGDVILDPFLGSGTTACACLLTNREYIGIEMDENYFKISEQRIKYYEKKARLNKRRRKF